MSDNDRMGPENNTADVFDPDGFEESYDRDNHVLDTLRTQLYVGLSKDTPTADVLRAAALLLCATRTEAAEEVARVRQRTQADDRGRPERLLEAVRGMTESEDLALLVLQLAAEDEGFFWRDTKNIAIEALGLVGVDAEKLLDDTRQEQIVAAREQGFTIKGEGGGE